MLAGMEIFILNMLTERQEEAASSLPLPPAFEREGWSPKSDESVP